MNAPAPIPPTPPRTQPVKAVAAFVLALVGSLATAVTDGHVTGPEWLYAVLGAVVAAGTVYGVTNPPRPPR